MGAFAPFPLKFNHLTYLCPQRGHVTLERDSFHSWPQTGFKHRYCASFLNSSPLINQFVALAEDEEGPHHQSIRRLRGR